MIHGIINMSYKRFLVVLLLSYFPFFSKAQTWEVGLGVALSDQIYTAFPNDLLKFKGQLLQAHVKRNFDSYWSAKLGIQQGNFFESTSNQTQVNAEVEFNFFKYQTSSEKYRFSPFLTTGFSANPQTPNSINTLVGAGVKYNVKGNWNIMIDYHLATGKVFNTGTPNYKFAGLSLTHTFVSQKCPLDVTQKRRRR